MPAVGQKEEAEGLSPETAAWLESAALGDYASETFDEDALYEAAKMEGEVVSTPTHQGSSNSGPPLRRNTPVVHELLSRAWFSIMCRRIKGINSERLPGAAAFEYAV